MRRMGKRVWVGWTLMLSSLAGLLLSFHVYGLAAQADIIVVIVTVLLLFAGVMLGRMGLWMMLACCLPMFVHGTWVDARSGGVDWGEASSDALPTMLGTLIVALILDRLIGRVRKAQHLTRDLALVCVRLEQEIRERELAYQQLVHSQRVEALGRLASNVAHDFNNVLGIIRGYVYRAGTVAGDDVGELLNRIDAATRRGQQLTSKLLTLARSNEYLIEVFDINEAMRALWPLVKPMFAPDVALLFEPGVQAAMVQLDRAGFEAVLLNLAKNASDSLQGRPGGVFRLYSTVSIEAVEIVAEDNGHGMAPDVAARAFEPFFSTKPQGQGSGIGLAAADRVITEAGGNIRLNTVAGDGACFTLTLPLASSAHTGPSLAP